MSVSCPSTSLANPPLTVLTFSVSFCKMEEVCSSAGSATSFQNNRRKAFVASALPKPISRSTKANDATPYVGRTGAALFFCF